MQPKPLNYNFEKSSIFEKLKIDIFVITKKQNIILNHIPPRMNMENKMGQELKKKMSWA